MPNVPFNAFVRTALDWGADRAKIVVAKDIVTAEWVRMKCRYGCDGYGLGHLCPPRTPSPEDTRRMLSSYTAALLFTFDGNHCRDRGRKSVRHRQLVFDLERLIFLGGFYRALGMGCGPCRLCRSCDVDQPCRHPDSARPAMEACGIDVFQTMANAGLELHVVQKRTDPYTMVGLVLIE